MATLTPAARRHQQALAAQVADGPQTLTRSAANAQALMLAKLDADRQRLRTLKSRERKREVKRELLLEYAAWTDGALAQGNGAPDIVLGIVMVWAIDAGQYERALQIGDYVLAHRLTMPDDYQRDAATVLLEEVAQAAINALQAGEPFDAAILARVQAMTQGHDIHDQARAKLYKAVGMLHQRNAQWPDAVHAFKQALALDERAGCKRDLQICEKALKAQQAGTDPAPAVS